MYVYVHVGNLLVKDFAKGILVLRNKVQRDSTAIYADCQWKREKLRLMALLLQLKHQYRTSFKCFLYVQYFVLIRDARNTQILMLNSKKIALLPLKCKLKLKSSILAFKQQSNLQS